MRTSATSAILTDMPCSVRTMVFCTSSMVLKPPSARTNNEPSPSFSRPAPPLRLFFSRTCCRLSIATPRAYIRALSGTISKLRTKPPKVFTSATPVTVRNCGRITQSSKLRFSCKLSVSLSTVNINISPRGVVKGAMPPEISAGKFPQTAFKRSAICCLAQ